MKAPLFDATRSRVPVLVRRGEGESIADAIRRHLETFPMHCGPRVELRIASLDTLQAAGRDES